MKLMLSCDVGLVHLLWSPNVTTTALFAPHAAPSFQASCSHCLQYPLYTPLENAACAPARVAALLQQEVAHPRVSGYHLATVITPPRLVHSAGGCRYYRDGQPFHSGEW